MPHSHIAGKVPATVIPPVFYLGRIVVETGTERMGRVIGNLESPELILLVNWADDSEGQIPFTHCLLATKAQIAAFASEGKPNRDQAGITASMLLGTIVVEIDSQKIGRVVGNVDPCDIKLLVYLADGSETQIRFNRSRPATPEQIDAFERETEGRD